MHYSVVTTKLAIYKLIMIVEEMTLLENKSKGTEY